MIASSSISLQQQGAYESETVTVNPENGFTGTVSVALSGLPAGVAATPAGPYSYAVNTSARGLSFELFASSTAAVGDYAISVTGVSGAITHSATLSLKVTPQAPFTVHVSPSSLTLTPGSKGTVQISVTAAAGTSPSLSVGTAGLEPPLDSGVTLLAPQGFLTPSNPVGFTVIASAIAQPLHNFPLTVTATDSSGNSSTAFVPLTVSVPFASNAEATRSTFLRTDANPTSAVYDAQRKLIFVAVQGLNKVVVASSTDGHAVATIPVQLPTDIDESADGSEVFVGSESPFITIIDPNSLRVTGRVLAPQMSQTDSGPGISIANYWPVDLATLSNGKVLLEVQVPDVYLFHLYLWDPTTGQMTLRDVSGIYPGGIGIHRSADHSKVVVWSSSTSSTTAAVYDVASDTYYGPVSLSGNGWLEPSPDGSQIMEVGAGVTTFYDSQLNSIGSVALGGDGAYGAAYSMDGKYAYVVASYTSSTEAEFVAAINTTTFSVAGVVPYTPLQNIPIGNVAFGVDETGMMFLGSVDGMELLDVSSPGFVKLPVPTGSWLDPTSLSLSSPMQTELNGAGFSSADSYSVYFGAPPASSSSQAATNVSVQSPNVISLTAPTGAQTGSANVTISNSDGWSQVMPGAVSYGPQVLFINTNAGPPSGGSTVWIYGFGFPNSRTQVTIGGNPATILQDGRYGIGLEYNFSGMAAMEVSTPAGKPGPADVTVTTPYGSTTVKGGFQYLASAQVYPVTGALDAIIYDQARQRLYATNEDHNEIEVFNLTSDSYMPPVAVGNAPTDLALTPDGTMLAVLNSGDGTVSVIDPSTMQVTATDPVLTSGDSACGGVATTLAPVEPHRVLVDVYCTGSLSSGEVHLLNLDTGSLNCAGVIACDSNGVNVDFGSGLVAMAPTPDGKQVFMADISGISGEVGLLNFAANTQTTANGGDSHGDATADGDGNIFVTDYGAYDEGLLRVSTMVDLEQRETMLPNSNNLVGEKLNDSGSLLFMPQHAPQGPVTGATGGQSAGMNIFDVHTGHLVMTVGLPEEIPASLRPLALDQTGTKMFLISNSGITIAQLAKAPLSIATVSPSSGSAGTVVTIRGSGFEDGATVTFGNITVPGTFVDGQTLGATVPTLPSGPTRVTVTDPDGSSYFYDAAFTAN